MDFNQLQFCYQNTLELNRKMEEELKAAMARLERARKVLEPFSKFAQALNRVKPGVMVAPAFPAEVFYAARDFNKEI